MNIIDISHAITPKMPLYPGSQKPVFRAMRGKTSVSSSILMGSHIGTHVDAPCHVFRLGSGVDELPLESMVGMCRVLDFSNVKEAIHIEDLKKYKIQKGERIMVKTKNSSRGFKNFFSDYIYLSGEAAQYLGKIGIAMFGIDYLSVKQKGSADNRPHTELLKRKIVIFEGLNLVKVKAGKYFFVGLPLKFVGLDGSPARAILIPMNVGYKIKL